MSNHEDGFGVRIEATDRVRVKSYGSGARIGDCGVVSPIVKINRVTIVILDRDGRERAVLPAEVGVVSRVEGEEGYEYNRRCTCGAHFHSGCFCNLSPRQFFANKP